MPEIVLHTFIAAPRARVFDLARSIDAHQASAEGTSERAVAGTTSGLIAQGERVTWEARHFGLKQRLTVEIVEMDRPRHFRDVMVRGAFSSMRHSHLFEEKDGGTVMIDRFAFRAPLGWVGRLAEALFLTAYMQRFLQKRALALKAMAESEAWRKFLEKVTAPERDASMA